jgi:putative DNA primase/helicase
MSARDLADRLGLHRAGRDWRGDCPACGYSASFVLTETRDGKTLWWCAACDDREALTAAVGCERHLPPTDAANTPERPSKAQREAWATQQWERALGASDTITETYLASRSLGRVAPPALRFLPALRHRETGHVGPVMLAAVRDVGGEVRAVHRTWLRGDGTGKADVEPAKKTLGNPMGCAVRLAPADAALVLAEGIETAIAAGLLFDLPAWACLSAGGLVAMTLPTSVRRVLIAADHDPGGARPACGTGPCPTPGGGGPQRSHRHPRHARNRLQRCSAAGAPQCLRATPSRTCRRPNRCCPSPAPSCWA